MKIKHSVCPPTPFSSPDPGHRTHPTFSSQDPHLGLQERTNGAGLKGFRRGGENPVYDKAIKSPTVDSKAGVVSSCPVLWLLSQKPHPDCTGSAPGRGCLHSKEEQRQISSCISVSLAYRTSRGLPPT